MKTSTVLRVGSAASIFAVSQIMLSSSCGLAFTASSAIAKNQKLIPQRRLVFVVATMQSSNNDDDDDEKEENDETAATTKTINLTSFDQAGASLVDEEDQKRMEQMGDFDSNPNADDDAMERVRAAIRARTADLGLEVSKITEEYVARKAKEAAAAGPGGANRDDIFGGLDLSQISSGESNAGGNKNSIWADSDGEVPSMFFDPDEELTEEEKKEVDPIAEKNWLEQGLFELQQSTWPSPLAALGKVALMLVIVAATGTMIINWDAVVRHTYTDVLHVIPTKSDLEDYVKRFDSLDLPEGWLNGMNEDETAKMADSMKANENTESKLPDL